MANKTIVVTLSLFVALSLSADETGRSCSTQETEKSELVAAQSSTKPSDVPIDRVSFYEVGLVCTAAPKIGCGTMVRPALLSLAENSRVLAQRSGNAARDCVAAATHVDSTSLYALRDVMDLGYQPLASEE